MPGKNSPSHSPEPQLLAASAGHVGGAAAACTHFFQLLIVKLTQNPNETSQYWQKLCELRIITAIYDKATFRDSSNNKNLTLFILIS